MVHELPFPRNIIDIRLSYAYTDSMSTSMRRFNLFLSVQQRKRLDTESRKTGIPVAELIRRKIDVISQDERERLAGIRCGVSREEQGCDWPDAVASLILHLRAEIKRLKDCLK